MSTPTIRARLTRLDYDSFLTLLVLNALVWGACAGVLSLVIALLGGTTTTDVLGIVQFEGVGAGLVNLIWAPVVSVFSASICSPFLYVPFRWTLRLAGGLRVRVEPDVRPQPA